MSYNKKVKELLENWRKRFEAKDFFEDSEFVIRMLKTMIKKDEKIQGTSLINYEVAWNNLFIKSLIKYFSTMKSQDLHNPDAKPHEHHQDL